MPDIFPSYFPGWTSGLFSLKLAESVTTISINAVYLAHTINNGKVFNLNTEYLKVKGKPYLILNNWNAKVVTQWLIYLQYI